MYLCIHACIHHTMHVISCTNVNNKKVGLNFYAELYEVRLNDEHHFLLRLDDEHHLKQVKPRYTDT